MIPCLEDSKKLNNKNYSNDRNLLNQVKYDLLLDVLGLIGPFCQN